MRQISEMNLDLENTLMPWLGKTTKMMDSFIQDLFSYYKIDLTKKQWIVLKRLSQQDGLPQQELALITGRDKASLARLINTMEKKGLVARIPSKEDRRVNYIYMTKRGENIFEQTKPIIKEVLDNLQESIPYTKISETIEVIKTVQSNILINQEKLHKQ